MRLSELFAGVEAQVPPEAGALEVRALSVDSRTSAPGTLFAALRGTEADGARFAPQAVESGAVAVLAERPLEVKPAACVVAKDARRAFSLAAARFHGEPSRRLSLLAVTGTNGKTTTSYLCEQLATALGERSGLIGTVECRWPGHAQPATHTTPESHELQALLAGMVGARVDVAAIEISSHALAQERAAGCVFAAAAFTNLTRDHLDYHGTMEAYFDSKARLFRELLGPHAPAVLNLDDQRCAALAAELAAAGRRVIGFTRRGARPPRGASLLAAENLSCSVTGLSFTLRAERAQQHHGAPDMAAELLPIASPLLGAHNAENLLAAIGLLTGTGTPLPLLARVAAQARGAPGRLERVHDPAGRVVLVDYAHTDDALARALEAIARAAGRSIGEDGALVPGGAVKLICLFGCGGDRDRGKRPLMGRAAGLGADLVIATSDNPRSEDPAAILAEIEPGLIQSGKRKIDAAAVRQGAQGYCVEVDRREAIALALAAARLGDVVLIAGKGHEPYQIVGAEKRDFDDRREAARALAALSSVVWRGGAR